MAILKFAVPPRKTGQGADEEIPTQPGPNHPRFGQHQASSIQYPVS